MEDNKVYTAIVGYNGYGVFQDEEKLVRNMFYLNRFETKEFTDLREAIDWATSLFYKRQGKYAKNYKIDPITKVDWCYFRYKW